MAVNAPPRRHPRLLSFFLLLLLVLSSPFAALAEDGADGASPAPSPDAAAPTVAAPALPPAPIPLPREALAGLSDAASAAGAASEPALPSSSGPPPPFPKDPAELAALIGAAARRAAAIGSQSALAAISGGGVPKGAAAAAAAAALPVIPAPALMMGNTDTRHFWGCAEDIYRHCPTELTLAETAMFHGKNERVSVGNLARLCAFYVGVIVGGQSQGAQL